MSTEVVTEKATRVNCRKLVAVAGHNRATDVNLRFTAILVLLCGVDVAHFRLHCQGVTCAQNDNDDDDHVEIASSMEVCEKEITDASYPVINTV